jgi:hypothetical protein
VSRLPLSEALSLDSRALERIHISLGHAAQSTRQRIAVAAVERPELVRFEHSLV